MATKTEKENNVYAKIESLVMERVFSLEAENAQLRNDLAIAQAKLETNSSTVIWILLASSSLLQIIVGNVTT